MTCDWIEWFIRTTAVSIEIWERLLFKIIATALGVGALTALLSSAVIAHEVDITALPLNDGYTTTSPRVGSVFACQSRFNPNAPGAQRSGSWIDEASGTFNLAAKPIVDGAVNHVSELELTLSGNRLTISGNALPNHSTGVFPVSRTDDAYFFDRNPNNIRAHHFQTTLPADPEYSDSVNCVPMGAIGIMLTGAVLFNALDARGDNALAHEILDSCQGHPQRTGLYHYHGQSPCQDNAAPETEHSALVGYAFDGFGIYGNRGDGGVELHTDDLDVCHGHVGVVQFNGEMRSTYHYHATADYPYTVSCFRGTVVGVAALAETSSRQGGRNDHRPQNRRPPPPRR